MSGLSGSSKPGAIPYSLCDRVLIEARVPHGFGQRGSQVPDSTQFPVQVHGASVAFAASETVAMRPEADAIVAGPAGPDDAPAVVGIVTADCVPLFVSSADGAVVAAIHAGWRGLAAGVIEAGVAAVRRRSGRPDLIAAVGPAARACCYEVDEPVTGALTGPYAGLLDDSLLRPTRPGHSVLDLSGLATKVLESLSIPANRIGLDQRLCTICGSERFESYRRDGAAAGRLQHFIGIRGASGGADSLEG